MEQGKHFASRSLSGLFLGVLIALVASGCGAAGKASEGSNSTASTVTGGIDTRIITSAIPRGQRFRGDGDADNPGDIDGNGDVDESNDGDADNPVPESYRFPDQDDRPTFTYGHAPGVAEEHAIAGLVERYYAAAAAGSGAKACSLLPTGIARTVPEDYGQNGPAYLRGGKSCQTVLAMLFSHFHEQLSEAITVIEVRVKGDSAEVVLSSRRMPASDLFLARQGSSWKIGELLGQPLP
jgi:hypothetical protein